MPTFNANRAMTAASKKIDKLSDQLAFEIRERLQDPVSTNDDMIAFLKALLDVARSKESARQLIAGTFAQSNSGQPAAQLGAGQGGGTQPSPTPGQVTPQQALQVLAADPRFAGIGVMLQRAALSIQNPGNPAGVDFDANGDDLRIAQLRQELAQVGNDRDAAVAELREERDDTKSGSLAQQLATAQAAAAAGGGLDQAEVDAAKAALNTAEIEFGKRKPRAMGPGFVISDDQAQAVTDSLAQMRQIVGS